MIRSCSERPPCVDDSAALVKLLDDTYDRSETGEPEWIEHVTTDGMQRIRATFRLDGKTLHVETNSEARHERVLATLRGLSPSLTLVDPSRG